MKLRRNIGLVMPLLFALRGLAACGAADTIDDTLEETAAAEQPINNEHSGGVAEVLTKWMNDPEIARVSYAVAGSGCTGTMIGPNVMMTAAHCNTTMTSWSFQVYPQKNIAAPVSKYVSCQYLLHTFPDSDLMLLYCPSDPTTGLAPGDVFGYLDFESQDPLINEQVYSVWRNPIDELSLPGTTRIYSKGNVLGTASTHWASINSPLGEIYWYYDPVEEKYTPNNPNHPNYAEVASGKAYNTSVWIDAGGSGRATIDALTHRILIGPQSTGIYDGNFGTALSIRDYLSLGNTCDEGCTSHGIQPAANATLLASFGLSAATYTGTSVDNNENGLFDVQEHVEAVNGESARSSYRLDFDSPRRNALWTTTSLSIINNTTKAARLTNTGTSTGYSLALRHTKLNVPNNKTYRLRFTADTLQATYANALYVCQTQSGTSDCETVNLDPSAEGAVHAMQLTLGSSSWSELRFYVKGGTTVDIRDVYLVAEDAALDFDIADTRDGWRNGNNNKRGLIWPDGRNGGGKPDWAGVVSRDANRGTYKDDWSLTSQHFALEAGATYRVCFYNKLETTAPLSSGWGDMRVLAGSAEVASSYTAFYPSSSWAQKCSAWFTPTDDNVVVQFGTNASTTAAQGSYLIDDITVERQ